MTETRIGTLTKYEVAADGGSISLGFTDAQGAPASLTLDVGHAGALAMTLPKLIEEALRKQFSDQSLRYTYPLGSWNLEQATDRATGIITLCTTDGFSVRFAIQRSQQNDLGEALACERQTMVVALAN
jgi:hypothetical protein